jgi:hypothetical protein
VTRHEEYQDLVEKTRNQSLKVKKLRDESIYIQGTKKNRHEKIIKIQDDIFRD